MAAVRKQATLCGLSGFRAMPKSIVLLCVAVLLSACGQAGDLYLPDHKAPKKHAKAVPVKVVPPTPALPQAPADAPAAPADEASPAADAAPAAQPAPDGADAAPSPPR